MINSKHLVRTRHTVPPCQSPTGLSVVVPESETLPQYPTSRHQLTARHRLKWGQQHIAVSDNPKCCYGQVNFRSIAAVRGSLRPDE